MNEPSGNAITVSTRVVTGTSSAERWHPDRLAERLHRACGPRGTLGQRQQIVAVVICEDCLERTLDPEPEQ
ncbi:MAG: hypothetical protein R2716_00295 [Microthrixaceae bacterium]